MQSVCLSEVVRSDAAKDNRYAILARKMIEIAKSIENEAPDGPSIYKVEKKDSEFVYA